MARPVAYIAPSDKFRITFSRTLEQVGYEAMLFSRSIEGGLKHVADGGSESLIIIHGRPEGAEIDEAMLLGIREQTEAPVILLGFPADIVDPLPKDVVVVEQPITVAALAKTAASLRHIPHNALVQKLIRTRAFEAFSADAVAYLLANAKARQLQPDEVLFDRGDPGDCMYFVLVGSVAISLGARVLESVKPGGIFGEMAMLEGLERSARATSEGLTVLLEVDQAAIEQSDTAFRAVVFELITRTTIRRLRRTSASLREADSSA